jgi:hypothetical protein
VVVLLRALSPDAFHFTGVTAENPAIFYVRRLLIRIKRSVLSDKLDKALLSASQNYLRRDPQVRDVVDWLTWHYSAVRRGPCRITTQCFLGQPKCFLSISRLLGTAVAASSLPSNSSEIQPR